MGIIAWIVLGGIAGWIASKIMGTDASMGVMANIVVGIVGALIGGFLFSLIGASNAVEFDLFGLFVAVVGSVVLLGVVKAMGGSKPTA
jgi:uncharacterized membrane protein YeaQ/YmgE (transglycosylase-associated protein family)